MSRLRDPANRTEEAAAGLLPLHATDPDHESIRQHGGGHGDTMYTHHGFLLWSGSREIWATAVPPYQGPLERYPVRRGHA